jgi:hypothetical protein
MAARRGRSPLGPPAGPPASDGPGDHHAVARIQGGWTPGRCDGAPRGWPTIPMAWASARGIASKCRWPLRRGSSTRFGGGTSVAPPSQERPTPAGVTAHRQLGHPRPAAGPGRLGLEDLPGWSPWWMLGGLRPARDRSTDHPQAVAWVATSKCARSDSPRWVGNPGRSVASTTWPVAPIVGARPAYGTPAAQVRGCPPDEDGSGLSRPPTGG